MTEEIKDARYWHNELSKLIGEKLDSVACIGEEVESIYTKGKLTDEEISKVEQFLGKKISLSDYPFMPPPPYIYMVT